MLSSALETSTAMPFQSPQIHQSPAGDGLSQSKPGIASCRAFLAKPVEWAVQTMTSFITLSDGEPKFCRDTQDHQSPNR